MKLCAVLSLFLLPLFLLPLSPPPPPPSPIPPPSAPLGIMSSESAMAATTLVFDQPLCLQGAFLLSLPLCSLFLPPAFQAFFPPVIASEGLLRRKVTHAEGSETKRGITQKVGQCCHGQQSSSPSAHAADETSRKISRS